MRRGLYFLTRETADDAALLAAAGAALDGGATLLQYRDKSGDPARRLRQACALVALCDAFGVPLIVNDDAALARDAGAAGVHLGRDDVPVAAARTLLGGGAIIGVSCYDTLERAFDALRDGADYLAFGSFFASPTKPGAPRADPALLGTARALPLPKVAIGGITPENAGSLVAAGADLVAVSSAILDAPDPRAAARAIASLFDGTDP
jgi:thiamine-phosphate pyrophosphorylase